MRHCSRIVALSAILIFAFPGCQSHQAKVDALQKEYDRLGAQFQKDCSEEYLKVPPTLSEKCTDEKKQTADAWKRLQDERAKQ
jgi:hypothetical protein